MTVKAEIEEALRRVLAPDSLAVTDESEQHRGHSGWREGGETHFRVEISSERFSGMTRLQAHQLVHKALSPSPLDKLHALSISTRTG